MNQELKTFARLLLSIRPLYLWEFDRKQNFTESSCPDAGILLEYRDLFFFPFDGLSALFEKERSVKILTSRHGISWAMVPDETGAEQAPYYAAGPFYALNRRASVLNELEYREIPDGKKEKLRLLARSIPLVGFDRMLEYIRVLYYAANGKQLENWAASTLSYEKTQEAEPDQIRSTYHGTYELEREMLQAVREGDPDKLKLAIAKISTTGKIGHMSDHAMTQMRTALITNIILFSRAAIEGGLDPEISLSMSDVYLRQANQASSLEQFTKIATELQTAYTLSVRRQRTSPYTSLVTRCIALIEAGLKEPVGLKELASTLYVSPSYLSRCFKKETGVSLNNYIRDTRLEAAAADLRTGTLSVEKIAEKYAFCAASYFSEQFKKKYGLSPLEYRNTAPDRKNN